ncbi:adenosylcobinamide amidohydrolase [Pseudobacillus wudalianchiensis]|uniref:ABC transporter ATP-binding protein n=1 Tax=Pseudobacillus wudalianchiensis TaxID=1743143 RepID=A0A1B9AG18_9BACI|nr:adenosylcobinamide amidohydrolase [Bacillus wudalianchiensis]OCA82803.1 ABC transporter ATP-binding protein [Bacillus wudalianchiensis]
MIQLTKLSGGYDGKLIVRDLSFSVQKGELFGILGPNGSGKTTLLKMMSGIVPVSSGSMQIEGKEIKDYKPKELAKRLAVLPQMTPQAFSYTVKETVSLGRYAHQSGLFPIWTEEDEQAVNKAMERTGTIQFANTSLEELSGGERQRVFLAQALAQEPEILLLDEPTNHLDLSFQKELLDLLKKMASEAGLTVVSIFHDLNLASLYCDRLLLMEDGTMNGLGIPSEVLKEEPIQQVYKTAIHQRPHPEVPKPQMSILPEKAAKEETEIIIDGTCITHKDEFIALEAPVLLKTLSAGVIGAGWGWHRSFVNRHVDKNYWHDSYKEDMKGFLKQHHFDINETVGMMTAVHLRKAAYRFVEIEDVSVFVVVTAGVGNAVDVSRAVEHSRAFLPGTINTWVFANGYLSEEAFVQSVMTATEAKVKALFDKKVKDPLTHSWATGTSTDSVLIAATQRGAHQAFAGTISPLGQSIGKAVYECTIESLEKSGTGERI